MATRGKKKCYMCILTPPPCVGWIAEHFVEEVFSEVTVIKLSQKSDYQTFPSSNLVAFTHSSERCTIAVLHA